MQGTSDSQQKTPWAGFLSLLVVLIFSAGSSSICADEIATKDASWATKEAPAPSTSPHISSTAGTTESTKPFVAGDALQVYVFPDTVGFPNGIYPIDDSGFVDFPIVGLVKVTSFTPNEVAELINTAYVDYLRSPKAQVRPLIRLTLQGGFANPGLYYVDPRLSLWGAIALAGGTAREDGIRKIRWERDRTLVSNDLVPHFQSGVSLRTIGFKSGDQLWTTVRQKRMVWEVIVRDIIPIITVALSTAMTTITFSQVVQDIRDGNNP